MASAIPGALFLVGRFATGAFMIVAAIYAPLIAGFGSLFEYFQATLAYLVPPFVASRVRS